MIFADTTLTPSTPVQMIVYALILPILGFMIPVFVRQIVKYTRLESKVEDNCHKIAELERSCNTNDTRVDKLEALIQQVLNSDQRRDEQFSSISKRLEDLPSISTMLHVLTTRADTIVPRTEVDKTMSNIEKRIEMLELDVRAKRSV